MLEVNENNEGNENHLKKVIRELPNTEILVTNTKSSTSHGHQSVVK